MSRYGGWTVHATGCASSEDVPEPQLVFLAVVKCYRDVLRVYEFHPEAKCADSSGVASTKQTIGLLARRHVSVELIRYIGKESNSMENIGEGGLPQRGSPYTEYPNPKRDEWSIVVLPKLTTMPMKELQRQVGLSRGTLQAIRAGRRPHPVNRALLEALARRL